MGGGGNDTHGKKINFFIHEMHSIMQDSVDREYVVNQMKTFKLKFKDDNYIFKLLFLRTANLLLAKYEFTHRYTELFSMPFLLMLDPSNTCQLHCPGCLHTIGQTGFIWENAVMTETIFDNIITMFGPYCMYMDFYNYGEPFINKLTPMFVSKARKYGTPLSISTNLSLRIDAEEIVKSGLDMLLVSIDGATPETYSKYRRGGNFNLVLENIKKLVSAKKEMNVEHPAIVLRFLTFEHNVHEIDEFEKIVKEMDVNMFAILTPFSVEWDDPNIKVASVPNSGHFVIKPSKFETHADQMLGHLDIDTILFAYSNFLEGCESGKATENPIQTERKICTYLYQNITFDAFGNVMPCCQGPKNRNETTLHYGTISDNCYNSDLYIEARKYFVNSYNETRAQCKICKPPVDLVYLNDIRKYMYSLRLYSILDKDSIEMLTNW
ncbi:hypothetical protein FACS1894200_01360 [Spirochaetia bacterium]|nr:hypothetical protein FACS1894200_01360 [Spirochaetia bacterium]